MKYIDMHTHTTASDGVYTPCQLVKYGILKGLHGIAITDHDTVEGIDKAVNYLINRDDFIVIPGIELSTEYMEEEVHILGYAINYKCNELLHTLSFLQKQRENRIVKIIEKLQNLGIEITYNEILNMFGNAVLGRPHIAKALIKKGYVDNIQEAFNKYLNKGCVAYVSRYKITPFEAIDLIKKARGFTTIAHPKLINSDKVLMDILEKGVDGIEVYHPEHKKEDQEKFLNMAKKCNLIVTAGSDFHSPPTTKGFHGDLGDEKISIEKVYKFINATK